MHLLFIVNTAASSVTERFRVVVQKALAADHQVAVAETSRRGHATRLAQGAAAQGVDAVVVLGGDGTLNEAANGLAGSATALGVLPGGSTNVFARTLGMINDPIEATGQLLGALGRGAIRRVSLGEVNGRYFLFHVGIGFDAAVVARVERRSEVKRYAGHALFVWAALSTWARGFDRSRPAFTVVSETEARGALRSGTGPRSGSSAGTGGRSRWRSGGRSPGSSAVPRDGLFGICLKTNPYTFLGDRPLSVAPGTGFDTGLAMVTFSSLDLGRMLPLAARAMSRGGGLEGRRGVTVRTDLDEVVVEGRQPIPYQADGDYLGETDRLVLRCRPDALALVTP